MSASPLEGVELVAQWNAGYIILSYAIACLGSMVSLELMKQRTGSNGLRRKVHLGSKTVFFFEEQIRLDSCAVWGGTGSVTVAARSAVATGAGVCLCVCVCGDNGCSCPFSSVHTDSAALHCTAPSLSALSCLFRQTDKHNLNGPNRTSSGVREFSTARGGRGEESEGGSC